MTPVTRFLDGSVTLYRGDARTVLSELPDASIDAVVTDPPYAFEGGFMGKRWDTGAVAFDPAFWREVLRVLKPGGHLVACGGTRTQHRLVCAIEDAGFEIRDALAWLYGQGFPKSLDVSKALDRMAGAEREVVGRKGGRYATPKQDFRNGSHHAGADTGKTAIFDEITTPATDLARQWSGWGSALKPAMELICLARKPLIGTLAANVAAHGTGALNIDGCRVPAAAGDYASGGEYNLEGTGWGYKDTSRTEQHALGRWPANVVHDGSDEVMAAFAEAGERQSTPYRENVATGDVLPLTTRTAGGYSDTGSAARFFASFPASGDPADAKRFTYTAKADQDSRAGSAHPTIKPLDLMRWLVRLVTPPNGLVLDPFAGSGTTGEAAVLEGMRAVLIEREAAYCDDIARRMDLLRTGPDLRALKIAQAREERRPTPWEKGTLFAP